MKKLIILIITILAISSTAACSQQNTATPTLDPFQIQTQAVGTFAAGLTQTAIALPTSTPTFTPTPTSTETPTPSPTATSITQILPTTSCNSLTFIKDITIPDNSKLAPGQAFTKTWRVQNSGTCDWEKGFLVKFFSGNAMGGKSITLENTLSPGKELDISIKMTAPSVSGVYTGNWRMTDDSGAFFGDSFKRLRELFVREHGFGRVRFAILVEEIGAGNRIKCVDVRIPQHLREARRDRKAGASKLDCRLK